MNALCIAIRTYWIGLHYILCDDCFNEIQSILALSTVTAYVLCPGYWVLCYSKRVIRHCLSSLHYTLSALQMEYSLSSTHERLSVTHSIIANPLSTSKLFIIKPCQSWWRRVYPVSPNTSIGSQLRSFTKNSCC